MMEFLAVLAVFISDMLGRLRRWLTFRRVLGIVALLILLLSVRGLIEMGMGTDLPVLFGLDWGLALEVSALMIALSVRDHAITVAYVAKRWVLERKAVHLLRRVARRDSRSRPTTPLLPPPPEDEPAVWAPICNLAFSL